jgi:hypothetical protein
MRWVKDEVGGGGSPEGKCVVRVVGGGGGGFILGECTVFQWNGWAVKW